MEKIYDSNDIRVGCLKHNNTVYDRYHRVVGYIDAPVLYDADYRQIGYVRNGTIYKRNGHPTLLFQWLAYPWYEGTQTGVCKQFLVGTACSRSAAGSVLLVLST